MYKENSTQIISNSIDMKKVILIFGTRPEAIKMAPLVSKLKEQNNTFDTLVCVTGQHRQMLDQVLRIFDIVPDYDLNIMKPGQDLYDVTSRVLVGLREVLQKENPSIILVHGDTTTSMSAALAAYYQRIPVAHVEAGLRTYDIYSPWPEEMNRQITGRIASIHFAPTLMAKQNLIKESIAESHIFVTGNTVIDTLQMVSNRIDNDAILRSTLALSLQSNGYDVSRVTSSRKLVLITGHRRENYGGRFISICEAIKDLSIAFPDVDFIYPMHLNPNVRNAISEVFKGEECSYENLFFIEPLEYLEFVYLMKMSYLVLTDSGGIQEEAPGLGKPVLVMRDTTERPEAVIAGTVKLVGANKITIFKEVSNLLIDEERYSEMSRAVNPYGDGLASERIVSSIEDYLDALEEKIH